MIRVGMRAARVDHVVGPLSLLVDGELRGQPPLRLLARQPVARDDARNLRVAVARDDDDALEVFFPARLVEQWNVGNGEWRFRWQRREERENRRANCRM